jgi:hypothetical protein
MTVAQLRLVGDADTLAHLVAHLNEARIDGVQFAIQTPRSGRKGSEHLAYGTVRVTAPDPGQPGHEGGEPQ